MSITFSVEENRGLVEVKNFDIGGSLPENISVKEINIVESLLSPSVQVMAVLQSAIYVPSGKTFDQLKNKDMTFMLNRKGIDQASLRCNLKTYRLDNRNLVQNNMSSVEEMVFHAIDETVLEDAKSLVSKSWKCTQPSDIVRRVLEECLGASDTVIDDASPARDYIAENLHPFRVVAQQAEVGLDGDDPSFLHFMTLDEQSGKGVHHFQSLKSLTKKGAMATYFFSEPTPEKDQGANPSSRYDNKRAAISFSFPCDFDYLSDLLNGLDENGQNQNSLATVDFSQKIFSLLGGQGGGDCGQGKFNFKMAHSNAGSAEQRNSCNLDVESHLLKRQARMGLLEKDKIALRITVPWSPELHAGKVINFEWMNKEDKRTPVYGAGEYLIVSLMHTVRMGGYAVTTMDCVTKNIAQGN